MKVGAAIAEIMKREGFEILCAYPVNHLIEHAAELDIRTVIVRQERIGLHMADAISRVTSGRKLGSFCMQHPDPRRAGRLSAPHRAGWRELFCCARHARRVEERRVDHLAG